MKRKLFHENAFQFRHKKLLLMFLTISILVNMTLFKLTGRLQNLVGKNVFQKVDTILKEELVGQQGYLLSFKISRISSARNVQTFQAVNSNVEKNSNYKIPYVRIPFNSQIYMKGNIVNPSQKVASTGVQKYFEALRTTTGHCKKLVRVGGELSCNRTGDENGLDGNKLICVHPLFRVGAKNYQSCLVMSFGIDRDTSFDESIADMNCQVHMFDILNYTKEYFKNDDMLNFHQMGLATKRRAAYYAMQKILVNVDDLKNIIFDLGLEDRLINILKIDIEGNEWDVLHDLSSQTYLNAIGQIAVEVHALDLLELSDEKKLEKTKYWIRIIEALEAKGFRRVSYWDNNQPKLDLTDVDGSVFATAGELLLINYNWYNESFWADVRQRGYLI